MEKKELLYEGKAKKLYATNDAGLLISEFKDDLTAFNAVKKGNEEGKGALNCKISTALFGLLHEAGIKSHLIETISSNAQVVKKVKIIPIEVIVRNTATGSLTKRLGIEEGKVLPFPLVEFCLKDDALGDSIMNDEHALVLGIATQDDIDFLKNKAREINGVLKSFFYDAGLNLIDFKIEFGKDEAGNILLADEISPDSCRFWDVGTGKKMDKDIFRQGLGSVKVAYEEVLNRILGQLEKGK
jgi:phosphoribosylaminoimidazole-succinocarboxamide synthase